MSADLLVETIGPVGLLRLNRPEARNALSNELLGELVETLEQLEKDGTRCGVIAGSDRVFAAGADLRVLATTGALEHYFGERHASWDRLRRIRMPLVAAVAGYCLGGGFELALACDIVVAADNATFGLPETGIGLIPGAGGTQRLPRILGKAKAMDVILTGRRLSADEAEAAGIVARVVQLDNLDIEARAVADEIAARSTIAQRLAKETVSRSFDLTLEAGLEHERRAFALVLSSHDATEGITAFLEKRPPEWTHQ